MRYLSHKPENRHLDRKAASRTVSLAPHKAPRLKNSSRLRNADKFDRAKLIQQFLRLSTHLSFITISIPSFLPSIQKNVPFPSPSPFL
jgi:hypothetical protein